MNDPARSYEAALVALYALVPRGIVLGLDPIRTALAARGNPQRGVRTVHIAGTNGKGSVAAMVDAALRADGRRVGLYTSPHLHRFAERIRVDGEPAAADALSATLWRVLDGVEGGALPALTFFEAATLAAWETFAAASLDAVVLEVGLGGRLDATNACEPEITAITRIALDHESRLGNTLDAIAREKAGILKHGVPCVLGPDLAQGEARDAIASVARDVGAPLIEAPRARLIALGDALRARIEVDAAGGALTLDLALGGTFQIGNAAVAVGVLERMGVSHVAIREGMARVAWPARLERIGHTLFDAAHNPDGARALGECLDRMAELRDDRALVFGASSDKDWRSMLDELAPRFEPARRFFAAAGLRRAEDPANLARHAGGIAAASVGEALGRARAAVGERGLVVVCGSIFAVAEARAAILGIGSDPPVAM